ncbi:GerW family sporulation protein [Caloranaerobacter ferrireducens]|uniref:GerW family sporulation protein n=1 Tax=Caloranaerobacter ferrireducens TaxID=1323370 RepID=UPI00084D4209|nr:GerW family sporulation protein [Caloranaerobacter ferrireducens]
MSEHPIEGLMKTTMESLKEIVDVNTIVGDPVESPDGAVIIPISKISVGFTSGGGEYKLGKYKNGKDDKSDYDKLPFMGGSGAGVSVQPVAFIVVGNGQIKLLSVDQGVNTLNSLLEFIPKVTESLQSIIKGKDKSKNSEENTKE